MSRIPIGIREQPAWIFIGFFVALTGFSFVIGLSKSPITIAIGLIGTKIWGGCLFIAGVLLIIATARAKPSLEKLSLRILSCAIGSFAGWVALVVPIDRIVTTVALASCMIAAAEFRVFHLRIVMKQAEILKTELRERAK